MSAGDLDGDRLGDGSGCHSGGRPQATDAGSRWVGGRQAEKWVLFEYVRAEPQGTPLSKIVSDVFGDVRAGSADYQLARRFFRRHDDLFLVENRGDLCYVEPRPAAFGVGSSLEFRSKQTAKTQEGEGAGYDTSETGPTAGRGDGRGDVEGAAGPTADCCDDSVQNGTGADLDEGAAGPTADCCDGADGVESRGGPTAERFPKDRARRTLSKRTRLDGGDGLDGDGHDYRPDVFRELARYRDETDDKWQYFERLRGAGSQYLVKPYSTRYNDVEEATEKKRRYRGALRRASSRYDRAAKVSLTVAPNRFESHSEATEAIRGAVSKWMQREAYQLGGTPDNLKVVDFQRNGLPHYHVVLFGVSAVDGDEETEAGEPTLSTGDVRQYWDEQADVGREVAVRPAYCRGDGDEWILHDDEGGRVSLGYYLGKRIRGLVELAETDTGDLFEAVEAGDLSLWRHALFWAYEMQYCTVSPSLLGDRGDGLPAVRIWRYVGACRFDQIPRHVLDDGVICRPNPPPD